MESVHGDTTEMADVLASMPDPRETMLVDIWDGFLSGLFSSASFISQIGIFMLDTGEIVGKTSNFHTKVGEFDDIVKRFDDLDALYRHGVTVNGETFKVQLADGRFGIFAKNGTKGCSIAKTFSLLFVSLSNNRGDAEKCNELVMSLSDYFFKKGL